MELRHQKSCRFFKQNPWLFFKKPLHFHCNNGGLWLRKELSIEANNVCRSRRIRAGFQPCRKIKQRGHLNQQITILFEKSNFNIGRNQQFWKISIRTLPRFKVNISFEEGVWRKLFNFVNRMCWWSFWFLWINIFNATVRCQCRKNKKSSQCKHRLEIKGDPRAKALEW